MCRVILLYTDGDYGGPMSLCSEQLADIDGGEQGDETEVSTGGAGHRDRRSDEHRMPASI